MSLWGIIREDSTPRDKKYIYICSMGKIKVAIIL